MPGEETVLREVTHRSLPAARSKAGSRGDAALNVSLETRTGTALCRQLHSHAPPGKVHPTEEPNVPSRPALCWEGRVSARRAAPNTAQSSLTPSAQRQQPPFASTL